jgi:hypothetical protein
MLDLRRRQFLTLLGGGAAAWIFDFLPLRPEPSPCPRLRRGGTKSMKPPQFVADANASGLSLCLRGLFKTGQRAGAVGF